MLKVYSLCQIVERESTPACAIARAFLNCAVIQIATILESLDADLKAPLSPSPLVHQSSNGGPGRFLGWGGGGGLTDGREPAVGGGTGFGTGLAEGLGMGLAAGCLTP